MPTPRKTIPIKNAAADPKPKGFAGKVAGVHKPLVSWSFTRYNDYKTCPFKFYNKHILKIQEPPNDAMARGSAIHKIAEDYTKGILAAKMPKELSYFSEEFKDLRKMYKGNRNSMIVEDNWGFKSDWSETAWNDWNNCWLRVKLDLAFTVDTTLHIIDHKTGKNSPYKNVEYEEQEDLYALTGMVRFPHVEEVRPRLWYLDEGTCHPEESGSLVYTPDDLPRLKKTWTQRVAPMFNDKTFKPTPNKTCQWCHYRASNAACGGGQCKF